jgi:GAF domain-containing protein
VATASERLHLLYEVNRRLGGFTDLAELVHYATRRTRELFDAEGCALLLVDRTRNEFYFPVASQRANSPASAQRLAEIRFPADRGIAGWVLEQDQSTLVEDVSRDSRFYSGVDQQTHMATRALLCSPLRTPAASIGVIEVVNPSTGALSGEDLEFLEALATDVALAYEKAALYERLRGEVVGLRQVCGVAGYGLVMVGAVFGVGTTVSHLAQALPLAELLTRPAWLASVAALLAGAALVGVARGWLVRRAAPA